MEHWRQSLYDLGMRQLFLLALFICTTLSVSSAIAFPANHPVPGGTAVIQLPDSQAQPRAFYRKLPVAIEQNENKWFALIGLSLSTKPGKHFISYQLDDQKKKILFTVKKKIYKAQYLTVKNKRKVNPNAEDMKRILREKKIKQAAKSTFTNAPVESEFIRPVEGRISSIFGLRRFFNKQPRRPHSGLDIAAPEGTPVKAVADGQVIETGNFFFSGNMIYLDHGQGVISLYAHLHKINVKPGQRISQGDIIGEVGETGRVTGPHLHLSLLLNRTAVDPEHWLPAAKAP